MGKRPHPKTKKDKTMTKLTKEQMTSFKNLKSILSESMMTLEDCDGSLRSAKIKHCNADMDKIWLYLENSIRECSAIMTKLGIDE